MTQNPTPPAPPAGAPQPPADASKDAAQRNTIGLIALITAIVGFIFACIPGALIMGWILLPTAFVLAVVALTRSGQKKGMGITALILSIVGTIVGVFVFMAVAAGAVSDAFDEAGGGDTTVVTEDEAADEEATDDADGADAAADSEAADEEATDDADGADAAADSEAAEDEAAEAEDVAEAGTRDNPHAFTDAVQNDNWTIAFTDFNGNANDEVAAANQFNDEAADGTQWITVAVDATYTGADTGNTLELSFDYVTADGTVIGAYDSMASGLEPDFDNFAELYEDGTESGKIGYLVPDSVDGLLRVTPGLFGDDAFFSLPTE
ncbi:DUF4190 domain-containing protein [Demequina flava]|uniref:DUF4190 domain-containing protein n=1 Tax=Demequina flava TaxID=1095025 RepID=UPI000783E14B|nr:DUF4190 domain-containing protein [Demequina flava]